ncbi:MAG: DNA-binding transcriptional LysR family regulator [Polyangiales bacterium]|jgi:DNA-binding transcriptional LysR family regulator
MLVSAVLVCGNAPVNWETLRYILAVDREHTLQGAARSLGVTHTTVGRRIRKCEAQLGVRVFDRTPEGLFATPAGAELVVVAERLETEILAAESRVFAGDAQLSGPLRVSIIDWSFHLFHDVFHSFLARYPKIDLTVNATLDQVSLTRREADVVIRLTSAPPENLFGRRLGKIGFAVYGSVDLINRIGADAPYEAYPWLGFDTHLPVSAGIEGWMKANAQGAEVVMRIDESSVLARAAVQSGTGVFFLPTVEGDATPGLQRLGPIHFNRDLWLLTLNDLRHTNRIRVFMAHAIEHSREFLTRACD